MKVRSGLKAVLGLADLAFDSAVLRLVRPRPAAPEQRTALIVRVDRIGDVVLWLPAAHRTVAWYRERGYRVLLIVAGECADLARSIIGVDEVWSLDCNAFRINPAYRAAFLKRVAAAGADEALQPTYSRIPALGDALVRASGAARRIGWAGDAANTSSVEKRLGDRAYTELFDGPAGEIAETARNERLLDHLGIAARPFTRPLMPRRACAHPEPGTPYAVLVPGASRGIKQWPASRFAEIADRLHRTLGWRAVVCGSAADTRHARAIAAAAAGPVVDLTGRTSLPELADVIARAALVVANDTAAVHVAAAVHTKCVCVLGGGQFGRFLPYAPSRLTSWEPPHAVSHPMPCFGCDWVCRHRLTAGRPAPCIDGITTDAVWAGILVRLEPEGAGSGMPPPARPAHGR